MSNVYYPEIGDVILYNGIPCVVVKIENYEDAGSCSYDRKYDLIPEEKLRCMQYSLALNELLKKCYTIAISGDEFPLIEKVENIAPYKIRTYTAAKIRQKKPMNKEV